MKKIVVMLVIVSSILFGVSTVCFASHNVYGFFASHVTTAVYSCDHGSTATDIYLGAEGIHHNPIKNKNIVDGAKTAFYKKCADKQTKKCSYFNLFSTYGYVTIGGQGSDDKYHKFRGYVLP